MTLLPRPSLHDRSTYPFTEYIVKTVSRCNLNCSYCYMYNLADRTYLDQPKFMSLDTTARMAERIATHAETHGLGNVSIIIHGGEPLLMGHERFRAWVETVRGIIGDRVEALIGVQTNGTLIDDDWIVLLHDLGVNVGVSIDGPQPYHDQFRLYHDGHGSFEQVSRGIGRLLDHPLAPEIFTGVLSVINTSIPPREYYDFMTRLNVPSFDILLPQANYDRAYEQPGMPLNEWIIELFNLWFERQDHHLSVRFFDDLLQLALGARNAGSEMFGNDALQLVVIETDGGIEAADTLKACAHGMTKLGLNVHTDELDAALEQDLIRQIQHAHLNPSMTCKACELLTTCGGGRFADRYSSVNGFDNPSVYCADIKTVVRHVSTALQSVIPPDLLHRMTSSNGAAP